MDTRAYIDNGWKFSELMSWIPNASKDYLLDMLGESNFVLLEQDTSCSNLWKGKFLISPEGLTKLTLYFMPVEGHG